MIFHVKRDKEAEAAAGVTFDENDDSVRFIKYDFGADFFKLKTIGARYSSLLIFLSLLFFILYYCLYILGLIYVSFSVVY